MYPLLRFALVLGMACVVTQAIAAKPTSPRQCYRTDDPTPCLIGIAQAKLGKIVDPAERADALGEWLYTSAILKHRANEALREARELARSTKLPPLKQMDLAYAVDIYGHALGQTDESSYPAALELFAKLDRSLVGDQRIELYFNACAIISWAPPLRERWLEFAQRTCAPHLLIRFEPEGGVAQALLMAMMPAAMTFADDRDGFAAAVDMTLSWLDGAAKLTRKKSRNERDLVAFAGTLIHTWNAQGFDAFDLPFAADVEIEQARRALNRLERGRGMSARSAGLRREVIESLFETGRETDARKMLRQTLARIEADAKGQTIPLAEQVAVLLLAARLERRNDEDRPGACAPDNEIAI